MAIVLPMDSQCILAQYVWQCANYSHMACNPNGLTIVWLNERIIYSGIIEADSIIGIVFSYWLLAGLVVI